VTTVNDYAGIPRPAIKQKSVSDAYRAGYDAIDWGVGTEEGERCGSDGCQGVLEFVRHGDCSCHLSSPCENCVNTVLECPDCGRECP
jgi:hypothetical protein